MEGLFATCSSVFLTEIILKLSLFPHFGLDEKQADLPQNVIFDNWCLAFHEGMEISASRSEVLC